MKANKNDRIDLYKANERFKSALERLKSANIREKNKEKIEEFVNVLISDGLSKLRIVKYIGQLMKISEWLGKDFDKATEKDIRRVVAKIESSDYSEETKKAYKVTIKRFYKWLLGNNKRVPEMVEWIKARIKKSSAIGPDDILTEDEIRRMVDAANTIEDKALVITLFETATRPSEFLNMRIKDFRAEDNGRYGIIKVSGKTGFRGIPVVLAVAHLQRWIENHPYKDNPNAFLWINRNGGVLSEAALNKKLKSIGQRAGIKKRITPYIMRHSRLTLLSKVLKESQIRMLAGWTNDSSMVKVYIHLSGRDVTNAVLQSYGLAPLEKEEPKLKPKPCPRCGKINPPDAKFCYQCGLVLDQAVALKMEETKKELEEIYYLVMKDENLREKFMEFKESLKENR